MIIISVRREKGNALRRKNFAGRFATGKFLVYYTIRVQRKNGRRAMLYHILAVGDVVMEPGLRHLERHLRPLQKWKAIDFTVVNGENAAGVGLTRSRRSGSMTPAPTW